MGLNQQFSFKPLIIILLFLLPSFAFADKENSGDSKSKKKEENSKANKEMEKTFNSAMTYFYDGNYNKSLPLLEELIKTDPDNPQFNFYLGVNYLISTSPASKAKPYLEKAVTATTIDYYPKYKYRRSPGFAYYYLAIVYHYDYKFSRALSYFKKFRSIVPFDQYDLIKDVDRRIQRTRNAMKLVKMPVKNVDVQEFSAINSDYNDYGGYISEDELFVFFTSKRFRFDDDGTEMISNGRSVQFATWEKKLRLPKVSKSDDEYKSSIFFTEKKDGEWKNPQYFNNFNNAEGNNQFGCLSVDGKYLYFSSDAKGSYDIYYSVKTGDNNWSVPQILGENINSKSNETNACLSPDGNTLYFVSDRKDGLGGKDIYYSNKIADGTWGKAVNMGRKVNSNENEESPFISDDGSTLYFSSQGHNSMGGYDIFYAKAIGDNYYNKFITNNWKRPENIGYPINTVFNDLSYKVFNQDKTTLYTSNSSDGRQHLDIFMVSYREVPEIDTMDIVLADNGKIVEEPEIETFKEKEFIKTEPDESLVKNGLVSHWEKENGDKEPVEETFEAQKESPEIAEFKTVVPQGTSENGAYTIHLGSGTIPDGYFDKIEGVITYEDENGLKQYRVGEYEEIADADVTRKQILASGYSIAVIKPINGQKDPTKFVAQQYVEPEKVESLTQKTRTESFVVKEKISKESIAKKKITKEPVFDKPIKTKSNYTTKMISSGEKLYTVQVGAGNMRKSYFDKLEGVMEFIGKDGVKRFMVGEFESFLDAVEKKKEIANLGYRAWITQIEKEVIQVVKFEAPEPVAEPESGDYEIVEKYPCDDYQNNVYYVKYTIQVGAGNMKYEYFSKLENVVICEGKYGLKRFVVGEFNEYSAAKIYKQDVKNLGYNAWIPSLKDHLCNCYKLNDVYTN